MNAVQTAITLGLKRQAGQLFHIPLLIRRSLFVGLHLTLA